MAGFAYYQSRDCCAGWIAAARRVRHPLHQREDRRRARIFPKFGRIRLCKVGRDIAVLIESEVSAGLLK